MNFPNLEAELSRNGLKKKDLAELFNGRVASVTDKLSGKRKITLDEAFAIRDKFFEGLEIDYLFSPLTIKDLPQVEEGETE